MGGVSERIKDRFARRVKIVEEAQANLDRQKTQLLTDFGWKLACYELDTCWRFTKEFNGKTLAVDAETALSIEASLHR